LSFAILFIGLYNFRTATKLPCIAVPIAIPDLKILIAEDHMVMRQMIAKALNAKGVKSVEQTADGKSACDMIASARTGGAPYHIVFADWNMPGVSGIDLVKQFRAQAEFATTGFIMVTAKSMQSEIMEAIRAGATAYMIKPITPDSIVKKLDETLAWINKALAK
jgi:two-component system chemotaxis response regulator CheY